MTPGKAGAPWCDDPELLLAKNRRDRALRTLQDARAAAATAQENLNHFQAEYADAKRKRKSK